MSEMRKYAVTIFILCFNDFENSVHMETKSTSRLSNLMHTNNKWNRILQQNK